MPKKFVLTLTGAALVLVPSASNAQRYVGECARAGQVAASMNLAAMVQNNDFRGYSMEPVGGGGCFIIAYYEIHYTGGNADEINFTYTSSEMIGESTESYCGTRFRLRPANKDKKDVILNEEINIKKQYLRYKDETCSVDLQATWTRKSKSFPALNQSLHGNATTWDVYNGKLISIDFPRFIHMEIFR